MAKIFQTSDDIVELAEDVFDSTGLPQVGINLKVMSVTIQRPPATSPAIQPLRLP